jgi:hypothetical protein
VNLKEILDYLDLSVRSNNFAEVQCALFNLYRWYGISRNSSYIDIDFEHRRNLQRIFEHLTTASGFSITMKQMIKNGAPMTCRGTVDLEFPLEAIESWTRCFCDNLGKQEKNPPPLDEKSPEL